MLSTRHRIRDRKGYGSESSYRVDGALYHVMCRGDRREEIFLDDRDRKDFLVTLGDVCEKCGFVVHSYVLMHNHYHLLLETPTGNLVARG